MHPEAVMIFAAGFGTRMRDLTRSTPKPMLKVAGRPMLDHTLDLIAQAGDLRAVVNTHYLADQIEQHLLGRPKTQTIREEPQILETGGGLRNALPLLGTGPVFTANSDVVWTGANPLAQLTAVWDPGRMDGLMIMVPTEAAQSYQGQGDFFMGPDGRLERRGTRNRAPFVYGGIQIIKTELLAEIPEMAFSVSVLWDRMITGRRLYGCIHSGGWIDAGHPEGLRAADIALRKAADV